MQPYAHNPLKEIGAPAAKTAPTYFLKQFLLFIYQKKTSLHLLKVKNTLFFIILKGMYIVYSRK
jgi:hypothetical protein